MRTRAGFFMPKIYDKPPLSIEQQINLLESRGLIIPDRNEAIHFLSGVSYYRLSGYTFVFEDLIQGKRSHQFHKGTIFNDIIDLYNFDRELRLLFMDAIERIEVAVRTQVCLKLALTYNDSHWYNQKNLFSSHFNHDKFLNECKSEFNKSNETFVCHYKNQNYSPALPPAWMIIELLSLGTWSVLYKNLAQRSDKKQIADAFDLSFVELRSWLHSLTYIPNLCAHHARLWNRHFTITPDIKSKYKEYLTPNYTFAAQAAMMHIMLSVIVPNSTWHYRLIKLITDNLDIDPLRMGFKTNWHKDLFWNDIKTFCDIE